MKIHLLPAALTLFLLLSACGTTTPNETLTATPRTNAIGTRIPTHDPDTTLAPTATHMPTRDPQATPTTNPYLATAEAQYHTEMAPFGEGCGDEIATVSISPDGQWALCDYSSEVVVVGRNGSHWHFSYDEALEPNLWASTIPKFWTADGLYLYFSPMAVIEGADTRDRYESAYALFRMDLTTGTVTTIVPGTGGYDTLYEITFSPTGRRFVYNTDDPLRVNVVDLNTGETSYKQFEAGCASVHDFAWSADGTRLSYTVVGWSGEICANGTYYVNAADFSVVVPPPARHVVSESELDSFPGPCTTRETGRTISPDEEWAAILCDEGVTYAVHRSGSPQWPARSEELVGTMALLFPAHWSADGKALFLVYPGYCLDEYPGTLVRLDFVTGDVEEVVNGCSFSFSPTEEYLTYWDTSSTHLVMRALATGEEMTLDLSQFQVAGGPRWSPDGEHFILAGYTNSHYSNYTLTRDTTLLLFDLSTRSMTELASGVTGPIYWVRWDEDDWPWFYTIQPQDQSLIRTDYVLDLHINQVTPFVP